MAKPAPTVKGGSNVLVIFVDTLRADRLGSAGYKRDDVSLTPALDAFAKDAVVFERAYSQAPNTPRSVPSFMSSRYPSQVKVDKVFKAYPSLLDDNDLLFEVLGGAGFTTIGETSHFYFCDRKKYPDSCGPVVSWMASNITQGAKEWNNSDAENIPESNKDVAGPRTVEKANKKLAELAKDKTKFAMLVHLFEPHSTYVVHPNFVRNGVQMSNITERGTKSLEQKYDYEVAFVDDQIGKLLEQLAATGLDKTTTVVVMADHGEAFGVHVVAGKPDFFHGDSLYAELIHVPLMFRIPGGKPCRRSDVVGLVDLAPTIAALFDVKPAATWQGRSLVPALACGELPPAPMFSELLRAPDWDHEAKSMVTADGFHVYFRTSDARWEVYDLNKDPDERTNIADGHPKLEQWKTELAAWIEGPLAAGGGK
ncbi:MAG: sulfatase [Proteobacteria bacterium]|nr:sulfatase [Pseudomonadota bacterium]